MYGAPRDGALIYVSCPTITQERRGVERVCPVQKECGCRTDGQREFQMGYGRGLEIGSQAINAQRTLRIWSSI